ncbi:MAG: flagellar brake protein [Burkholderiales bacterium]|nr:flagellar brake protein [Burkholderiales bacterium]
MATQDEILAQLDLEPQDSKYLIRSPVEILFILRTIKQQSSPVTLHFNRGDELIHTSILDVDSEGGDLVMGYGDNQKLSQQALRAQTLICTTIHDQAKVRFVCNGLKKIRFNHRDAFGAKVPEALLRVQRRENFRIATPEEEPLKCMVALPPGQIPATAEVILLDISCGGMAIIDPHQRIVLEPGVTYAGCRIDLPQIGTITFTMRIKEVFPFTLKNGVTCKRAGCEYVAMPESMASMVQRYIINLERERNARRIRLG